MKTSTSYTLVGCFSIWKATGGQLDIDVTMTGVATFRVTGGKIRFLKSHAGFNDLTGDFYVSGGVLEFHDASLETCGDLHLTGGEVTVISSSTSRRAIFGGQRPG